MEYTKKVAEFIANTRYGDIPPRAIDAAKGAILDGVGVALAGSGEEAGRIASELAREEGAKAEAAVFGRGFRSSAASAAFANGVAAHAMDYDASFTMGGQPMAGLVPAVFALAEASGASGRQLVEAYVVGYEVTGKVVWSVPAHGTDAGWHSTATAGTLGCTAAAAHLLGLDVEQTRNALGIATSMASGVVWNFGTMSKPLHAGLAGRNGVLAARLAQRGFTGNASVLEGPDGYFASFGRGTADDLKPLAELGSTFEVESGVKYKFYPCGGLTHTAIDAVLALRAEHKLDASVVERIDVQVTDFTGRRIIYRIPQTELQGKFSMPYIVARALIDGLLTPDTFSEAAIRDRSVLALAERVFMEIDPALEDAPGAGRPCVVTIQLKDGRTLSRRLDFPKGSTEVPLTNEELVGKFTACARRVLPEPAVGELGKLLQSLESVADARVLGDLLMGQPRPT